MRLCIVGPHENYLELAGVRIRYKRLMDRMAARGVTVEIKAMGDIRTKALTKHDIYLISKCYDARALLLARSVADLGRPIGVDLFDDYFSQVGDSRFVHHRHWLRTLGGMIDFALGSTPRMGEVAAHFLPGKPIHVLNDPFDVLDAPVIGQGLAANLERCLATRQIPVGWFGTGDNHHFPVGLSDLHAFGSALSVWQRHGYTVELSILTNARALTVGSLEMLRSLPVPHTIAEWSEEKEKALIARSLFCFLPTNAQNFSVAKSLNRAVTVLTGGSQVLSAGFPLYTPLGDFIYRDAEQLVHDMEARKLAVRRETLPMLAEHLRECADPDVEADGLTKFLRERNARRRSPGMRVTAGEAQSYGMVHGLQSNGETHKFVQRGGHLSIGLPFSPPKLNYDLRFILDISKTALDLEMTKAAMLRLPDDLHASVMELAVPVGKRTHLLAGCVSDPWLLARIRSFTAPVTAAGINPIYQTVTRDILIQLRRLIPEMATFMSEMEPILWFDWTSAAPAKVTAYAISGDHRAN